MALYDKHGGYTILASNLDKELKAAIEPILIKYHLSCMPVEDIVYIVKNVTNVGDLKLMLFEKTGG